MTLPYLSHPRAVLSLWPCPEETWGYRWGRELQGRAEAISVEARLFWVRWGRRKRLRLLPFREVQLLGSPRKEQQTKSLSRRLFLLTNALLYSSISVLRRFEMNTFWMSSHVYDKTAAKNCTLNNIYTQIFFFHQKYSQNNNTVKYYTNLKQFSTLI